MPGTGDGHHLLVNQPCECQLRDARLVLVRDHLEALDQSGIGLQVLALPARYGLPPVVSGNVFLSSEPAGEQAAPQRAVSDEADA